MPTIEVNKYPLVRPSLNNFYSKLLPVKTTTSLMNNSTKLLNVPAASISSSIYSHDCDIILTHIWDRLKLDSMEWRKIFKALHLLDIILKAGNPQCFSTIKGNIYKIKAFESFSTKAGTSKSEGIRQKAKSICEMLDNPEVLEEEREKTRQLRNKLSGKSVSSGIEEVDVRG